MKKKYLFITFVIIMVVLALNSTLSVAQPTLPSAPDQAPIDGGLALLAAAGGAYALRKLRNKE